MKTLAVLAVAMLSSAEARHYQRKHHPAMQLAQLQSKSHDGWDDSFVSESLVNKVDTQVQAKMTLDE